MEFEDNEEQAPPDRRATPDESLAAAEIAVFLEDDLGLDTRRLFIQVREGFVYIQGSVETDEQKRELEEMIPQRPHIKGCELHITVQQTM